MLLLDSSGRDVAREGALDASLEDTDGGSCSDSFRVSRLLLDELGAGETAGCNGVRSRGGRGGAGEEGLGESKSDIGGGGNGPAVECIPGW